MKTILILLATIFAYTAKSQVQEICPGPIPKGWVVISYRTCADCCAGTGLVNLPTIKKL
jgi:hypothetical protein